MAEAVLDKATSNLTEAKESVKTTAETAMPSLTEAKESIKTTAESVGPSLTNAEKTVAATTETVKTETTAAPPATVSTQVSDVVDKVLSSGIEGAKSWLQNLEQNRTEISSKIVEGVSNAFHGASSSTVASRDVSKSIDNQPLLGGVETTPWWENCCGLLGLLQKSSTSTTATTTNDEKSK